MPADGHVRLDIYDVLGRRVASLFYGYRAAGRHQTTWDGRTMEGSQAWFGVYFLRLEAGRQSKSARVILTP